MKRISILALLALLIIFLFSNTITGYFILERPQHCIEDKCIDQRTFSKLPPYPRDFSKNSERESDWKQPEYYNFDDGIKYYISPPQGYIGIYGYGSTPTQENFINPKEITTKIYFHTSWYVISYQGLQLIANYDKNYFDVEVTPDIILLEPTYPYFEYNWTQEITIKVKLKNPPKGDYLIGIDVIQPPKEFKDKWSKEYGNRYVSAGSFRIGKPFYQMNIRIQ
ncbi:MAG: hypothetical protein ACE5J4_01580 [Candidatus Aenigmatarchaeota archaeon]